MMLGIFTNSSSGGNFSINTNSDNWMYCKVCECKIPPRAWHCKICNKCCLKRDHHCYFFANCIGYYNQRYYIMFLFHTFVATMYAVVYNVYFLTQFLTGSIITIMLKICFPFITLVFNFDSESFCTILVLIHMVVAFCIGVNTLYQLKLLLMGKTQHENKCSKNKNIYDKGLRSNLVESLGTRWYLTWILPYIKSPLPGNGVEWDVSTNISNSHPRCNEATAAK
ncbi:probable palmitoyltransferase ZDHHC24 [Hyposmocoma kahamanoa]|uniref:probable palmitoyltransferase ZDHHC24 n=1 Tax=Hyposmocoma kahamanoa TaxID=1477025 RepID=UPI000E6D8EFC|nr:probable palmitoyltransferase ZDHHC24 [Hyposmocoma kahamanoa]